MHSIAMTYDQVRALAGLARDEEPARMLVSNPNGCGYGTVFTSFYSDDDDLTQHAIELDGCVSTMALVTA